MEQNKKESKSKLCAAAKKYPTKGKAYDALNNEEGKHGIYFKEEICNGTIKYICYGRCCNSVQDNELCHIHENQRKKEKSGFLYFEKDIKDKCDNVKIKKANASMSHFKQMGDRGRNKASKSTYHDFKNEDDPILMIIKHEKNPILLKKLKIYAIQLLNDQNISVKLEKKEEEKNVPDEKDGISKNKELLETIERLNLEHKKKTEDVVNKSLDINEININNEITIDCETEDCQDVEESEEDEEIQDNDMFSTLEQNDSDNIKSDHEEDDEYDVEPIYTNKGKLLYLEPYSNNVIEPEGESDGTSIGILFKVDKKYNTIKKDNEFYTVLSQNKIKYEETEYYRDVLNDRFFEMIDDNLVFRGRVNKKSDSSYKFHFD